jgi:erythromycin esterase
LTSGARVARIGGRPGRTSDANLPTNAQTIIDWLHHAAIPIEHIEAGNGFADLQPLKQPLADVKVVGLGEATHGTREFFQLKHHLLEFLVTEMGFRAFALEASHAACQPINAYVLTGEGDRASALTGQWYVAWDCEEFAAMLDWIRTYNQGVPHEQKVLFYGLDVIRNGLGRRAVLAYLRGVDPDRVPDTAALFEALAQEEEKWPRRIDDNARDVIVRLLPELRQLAEHLEANSDRFITLSSRGDYEQAVRYTRVMEQWILDNVGERLTPALGSAVSRSVSMAENLIALAGREPSEMKFVVWAHNYHIARESTWEGEPNTGYHLSKQYGQGYFAFGFEFNQGSFHTRRALPEGVFGDLQVVTLSPAPESSLPWYLSQVCEGALMVNLRESVVDPVVERWLHAPQVVSDAGWGYDEGSTNRAQWNVTRKVRRDHLRERDECYAPNDECVSTGSTARRPLAGQASCASPLPGSAPQLP